MFDAMKPVLQQEATGCGIASVATLAGVTYRHVRRAADQFGISAQDDRLWSDTPTSARFSVIMAFVPRIKNSRFTPGRHCRISRFLRSNGAWRVVELFGIGWCFGVGRMARLCSIQSGALAHIDVRISVV
jgi:hypothetical protein